MTEQEYKERLKEMKAARRETKKILKEWAEDMREKKMPVKESGRHVNIGYRDDEGNFVKVGDEYDLWLGMQCAQCDMAYGRGVTELKKEYEAGKEAEA